jgi:hypothetical protein
MAARSNGSATEKVFGFGSDLQSQAKVTEPFDLAPQDDPGSEGPRLSLAIGIALEDGQAGLPRGGGIGRQIGHGQDVGRGRDLTHGPRRESGEAGPVVEELVNGAGRHQLGAGLAVEVDEHGEDELDPVAFEGFQKVDPTRDHGSLGIGISH